MIFRVVLVVASILVCAFGPRAAAAAVPDSPVGPAAASPSLRAELRDLVADARDEVFPALVSIKVVTVSYFGGKEIKGQSTGSGTVIDAAGHVVTNAHVTQGGEKFACTLSDRRRSACELVGEDPLTDLAVLRLDLDELGEAPEAGALPTADFGDSGALEIGDIVLAMGSPFALSRSVSLGIVSNTERVFAGGFGSDDLEEMELERGQRTGLFTRWIQHDAVIAPGNSGGPLVNLAGEVVGVNELGGGNLSFAIPSDLARRVVDELIAEGEVERSWIGAAFQPVEAAGLDEGVLVSSVVLGGPAADAGVEAGDVLLRLDGEPITVRFAEEVPPLLDRIASTVVGESLRLDLERDGEPVRAEIVTERLEHDLGDEESFLAWGLTAQEITPKMARDLRLAPVEAGRGGVLITGVRRGGAGQQAEPPLEAGDVLRSIDGRAIEDLATLITIYRGLEQDSDTPTPGTSPDTSPDTSSDTSSDTGEPPPSLFAVERGGEERLALVRPRKDEAEDPPRELPKAWVGVAVQPVLPDLASRLGLEAERGLRITRVYPGTEAEKAGLRVGDVLLSVDGEALAPDEVEDASLLARRVRTRPLGETASLELLRDGDRRTVDLALERTRLSAEEARRHQDLDFELGVRELTFFDRDANRWDAELDGVLVESVDPGGWAGLGGLRPGDLVLRVDGREIRGLRSFREGLRAVKEAQPERVVVVVLRGTRTHFQFLEPDWAPETGSETP